MSNSTHLRLKQCFIFSITNDNQIFIRNESQSFQLSGEAFQYLLPKLEIGVDYEDILFNPPMHLSASEIAYGVEYLRKNGFLSATQLSRKGSYLPSVFFNNDVFFLESLDICAIEAAQKIKNIIIDIISLTGHPHNILSEQIKSAGFKLEENSSESRSIQIVVADNYLNPDLKGINQINHDLKRPWLLVKPLGQQLFVGPLIVPGETACWACLKHRLQYRRKLTQYLESISQNTPSTDPPLTSLTCLSQLVYAVAVAELIRFVSSSASSQLTNNLISFNATDYRQKHHPVSHRPQCACCGDPSLVKQQQQKTIIFNQDRFLENGAEFRSNSPEIVVNRLSQHISPITGLIGSLMPTTIQGDASLITTTYSADHNFALLDQGASFLQERIRGRASGKGKTKIQAKASALGESIERYSGVFNGDEVRTNSRFTELENAIHPNECMLYSDEQYNNRELLNKKSARFSWIPERFDTNAEIEWTPLWSLTHQTWYYLPTAYCFYGYSQQYNVQYTRADSNGCAAGSCLEDAFLQAFFELVERDSAALWWYNKQKLVEVDIESFSDPFLCDLKAKYIQLGKQFWVLDITNDLEIPSFVALCANVNTDDKICYAFGTHIDPKIAIVRATTELNQILPTTECLPHTITASLGEEAAIWWEQATLAQHPFLLGNGKPLKTIDDYPRKPNLTLSDLIDHCIQLAKKNNLNILALDQSRPDAGLKVIKLCIPTLRHFWPRFAPGRLYQVDNGARNESELNPYPIFI